MYNIERTESKTIIVKGRVQRVGYRNFIKNIAFRCGINGIARNLSNGDIEIFIKGSNSVINEFISLLNKDMPEKAVVECIAIYSDGEEGYRGAWRPLFDSFQVDWHDGK
jgi:acylphosphatase